MRKLLLLLLIGFFLSGCKQELAVKKKVELKTEDDKIFYALGAMFGARLNNLDLTDRELDLLNAGLRAKANMEEDKIDMDKYQKKVHSVLSKRMKVHSEKVKKEGTQYLENFVKSGGGKKTASGLAYKVELPGNDKKPSPTDVVEVHYHGTLINGETFDSSRERKKPVSFPLNRVIKGWSEGLQLIGEGGKIKLVIPSELAYGNNGAPPKIPGGATLIFDVELISIKKNTGEEKAKVKPKSKKSKDKS
jgi:FKBP-type peptidyl-prolyl cis-trans isomerase FkpA